MDTQAKLDILIRKWCHQRLGGLQYNAVLVLQHKSSTHCKISDANKYDICMRSNLSATMKLFISHFFMLVWWENNLTTAGMTSLLSEKVQNMPLFVFGFPSFTGCLVAFWQLQGLRHGVIFLARTYMYITHVQTSNKHLKAPQLQHK